ncbi:hypothetical protein [Psychrobacillus soli]|nr:hypothetical protein [Psychrobacillus soli]
MTTAELQEEFKRILEYGYLRGNENDSIKTDDIIRELSEQLRNLLDKNKV